jgi:hypothetical protein
MPGLSDFFTLIAEEKRKQEKEVESLIGDSFEKLFVEQLKTDNKNAVVVLEKELLSLKDISYSSIDKLMKSICAKYKITAQKLHDDFVKKHGIIPDEWIKKNKNTNNKLKSHKTPEELAKKHKVSVSQIKDQLKKGTKVEKEHTKDVELATTIASQHIDELPDYYDRLSKIEKKPIKEGLISEGLLNILPQEKTSDPLTPLNQNFATLDDLQNHYKLFLNRIQQQLSTLGGGGETNLTYMDVPVTSVTSSSYTIRPQDYYIGVNYAGAVTITLPRADREGKTFIVKDELGEASRGTNRYITILPTGSDLIDGRDRAILAFDYGSLTFIWKDNSWRVV